MSGQKVPSYYSECQFWWDYPCNIFSKNSMANGLTSWLLKLIFSAEISLLMPSVTLSLLLLYASQGTHDNYFSTLLRQTYTLFLLFAHKYIYHYSFYSFLLLYLFPFLYHLSSFCSFLLLNVYSYVDITVTQQVCIILSWIFYTSCN